MIISHLKNNEKTIILEKIQTNGGLYSSSLVIEEDMCNVTHLISDSTTVMNADPEALSDKMKCISNYNKKNLIQINNNNNSKGNGNGKTKVNSSVSIVDKSWINECISRKSEYIYVTVIVMYIYVIMPLYIYLSLYLYHRLDV